MMRMKHILLSALLLPVAATAVPAQAQNRLTVSQEAYYLEGDSVHVEMMISLGAAQVQKRSFVLLTPALRSGATSMEFPAVMINGKNRAKAYRRLVALKNAPVGVGQAINAGDRKAARTYRYTAAAPYEPWMREAEFIIREEQVECGGVIVPVSFAQLGRSMEDRNPPPPPRERLVDMNFAVSFKVPYPEPVKSRSEVGKAYLDFASGKSAIRVDYKNNAEELAKIGALIQKIKDDPYTTITSIAIDGYASPEGTYAANMNLSGKRAAALKDYLRAAYGLRDGLFRVAGKGEDWTTLDELVAASDMPSKDQILPIVRGTDGFDVRERKLAVLLGGNPYRYMLANLFPQLRRSDYEIKYTVRPLSLEESKQLLRVHPSFLSLNEMFLIAETYTPGSDEYSEVFVTAAEQFPQSDIANLNAAANALVRGDAETAQAYLNKVSYHDHTFENNQGVICAIRGDYEQAAGHFRKACSLANDEAVANLAELDKLEAPVE